jgi:hypothetical protein
VIKKWCANHCWIYGYTEVVVKILVSLDERLLERLDAEAASLGISRSALIGRMAAAALGEPVGPGAGPEARAALDRLKALFHDVHDPVDSTQVIRELRDSR